MNTNGNVYTIIYSAIIVTLVAAILALAATLLQPFQSANAKAETIRQMLAAAQLATKDALNDKGNNEILQLYTKDIKEAFLVNIKGEKVKTLNTGQGGLSKIDIFDSLKIETNYLKTNQLKKVLLPVYVYNIKGEEITVLPIYGAGLWGPVWGYLALKNNLKTVVGAYFDHESETPGLGAKIKDDPWFRNQFRGKNIEINSSTPIDIVKNGSCVISSTGNKVDAISGATLTSRGLGNSIDMWLVAYRAYINSKSNKSLSK